MTFRDRNVDVSGVDDRRGRGAPLAIGGGAGVLGLIVYLLVAVLGGGDASNLLQIPSNTSVQGTGESREELRVRCNSDGALERFNDCYLIKVYNEINEVWSAELSGYREPTLTFFEQAVQTGCGTASSQVGPFYCPPDQAVFIDLGFLQQLQHEFGANGRYAQAYILAHEVGHHLQTLNGTEPRVRSEQQRSPSQANRLSVSMELQADCFAGVWGKLADTRGNVTVTEAQIDEALNAAAAVGDDRIQEKTQGRVDRESWTHGSAQQRREWYLRGFQQASLDACNTF
jgi:predicted metalloprotease